MSTWDQDYLNQLPPANGGTGTGYTQDQIANQALHDQMAQKAEQRAAQSQLAAGLGDPWGPAPAPNAPKPGPVVPGEWYDPNWLKSQMMLERDPLTAGVLDQLMARGIVDPWIRRQAEIMKDAQKGWSVPKAGGSSWSNSPYPNGEGYAPTIQVPYVDPVTGAITMKTVQNPWQMTPINIDTTQPVRQFTAQDANMGALPSQYRGPMQEWWKQAGFRPGPDLGQFAPRTWQAAQGVQFNPQTFDAIPDEGLRAWARKLFGLDTPTTISQLTPTTA